MKRRFRWLFCAQIDANHALYFGRDDGKVGIDDPFLCGVLERDRFRERCRLEEHELGSRQVAR